MEISKLRYFVEVARAGSFITVAKGRDVDASIISRGILSLEQEVGTKLFNRTTRKVSLTEAGESFLSHVEPLLDEFERAKSAATNLGHEPSGTLRITAPISYSVLHLPSRLKKFSDLYPKIKIELLSTDTVVNLVENRIDVAIRYGHLTDSSHVARKLAPLPYAACASSNYLKANSAPKTPQDLSKHNCLQFLISGFNQGWRFRKKGSRANEVHISIEGNLRISNALALKESALEGLGIVLLPAILIEKELKDGSLKQILTDYEITATEFGSSVWMIYPSKEFLPGKTKAFLDFMLEK